MKSSEIKKKKIKLKNESILLYYITLNDVIYYILI